MRKLLIISTIVLLAMLTGCTSTKIISSWKATNPSSNTMDKVLVLALMTDREIQNQTEEAMTEQLSANGVNVSSAFDLFGPKRFDGLTHEEVVARLRGSNYTSVMIVSLVDKDKELQYVPGTYYPGYMGFYRRYWNIYDNMYSPGYYTTSTKYVLEADIYTVNDGDELIYSAQTRTYDPANIHRLAETFSKAIVDELKTKNLIR